MLTPFLEILDRLISLVKIRTESRRSLFVEHLEPLFNDLTAVHLDYRKAFTDTLSLLNDETVDDQALKDRLTERQAELLYMRQRVRALVDALSNNRSLPKEAAEFLHAIAQYFMPSSSAGELFYSRQTRYVTLLDMLMSLDREPEHRRLAAGMVKSLIAQTDGAWDVLLDQYAAARTALLK